MSIVIKFLLFLVGILLYFAFGFGIALLIDRFASPGAIEDELTAFVVVILWPTVLVAGIIVVFAQHIVHFVGGPTLNTINKLKNKKGNKKQ